MESPLLRHLPIWLASKPVACPVGICLADEQNMLERMVAVMNAKV